MAVKVLKIGDGTASAHGIELDIGGSNPTLTWDNTAREWNFTDGVNIISTSGSTGSIEITAGENLVSGNFIYISGWNSGNSQVEASKALVTTAVATTLYASYIATGTINSGAQGNVYRTTVLSSQNTSGLTVGRPVFLSTTAGGWTGTLPAAPNLIQVVGSVVNVHASTGRVFVNLPGIIVPTSVADQI